MPTVNLANASYFKFKQAVTNVTTSFSSIISNPVNSCVLMRVNNITFTNYSSSSSTVGVFAYNCASGLGTYLTSGAGLTIPARSSRSIIDNNNVISINEGDYIQANASVNSSISALVQYDRISEYPGISEGSVVLELLIVGGGGGAGGTGGWSTGGGGGAGGVLYGTLPASSSPCSFTITIGAGGGGAGQSNGGGGQGGTSTICSSGSFCYCAFGGGGGGRESGGGQGGSGGGGSWGGGGEGVQARCYTPPGFCGYGNNGGSPGAGGGAGGLGAPTGGSGGNGGIGTNLFLAWGIATGTGDQGWFGGGGGAHNQGSFNSGPGTQNICGWGGCGGGGCAANLRAFSCANFPTSGNAFTGGGGGAGWLACGGMPGGSGIAIIRYNSGSGSGGNYTNVSGGYTYHTFLGSNTFTFAGRVF